MLKGEIPTIHQHMYSGEGMGAHCVMKVMRYKAEEERRILKSFPSASA
jgi:hypothetical protein